MRKLKIILMLCVFAIASECNAQVVDSASSTMPKLNSDILFQKARNQKTAAWITLGLGTAASVAAIAIAESAAKKPDLIGQIDSELTAIVLLSVATAGLMSASIISFFDSRKNQMKARLMFENESNSVLRKLHIKGNNLSVKISVNF